MAPKQNKNNNNNNNRKQIIYRNPVQNKWILLSAGNSNVVLSSPFLVNLNAVAQGTSNVARVGSKVRMVEMDLIVQVVYGTGCDSFAARFLIVRDVAAEGVLTTNGEIFTSAGGVDSIRNYTTVNPDRYIVLLDHIFDRNELIPSTISTSTGNAVYLWRKTIKLGFVTDYSRGNAGTIADIDTNAITAIGICNATQANTVAFSFASAIRFTDE
jgi:hypothetical protein